jgi:hypothetical protein
VPPELLRRPILSTKIFGVGVGGRRRGVADIFISYTRSDQQWAFWIGQELERLGHAPHVHDWEIPGGGNIMDWMQDRLEKADHCLCVISTKYLSQDYSKLELRAAEWAAAKARPNFALPVFIEKCEPPIFLANVKRCDLFELSEDQARKQLTEYLTPVGKPPAPVPFPGESAPPGISALRREAVNFPGGAPASAAQSGAVPADPVKRASASETIGTDANRETRPTTRDATLAPRRTAAANPQRLGLALGALALIAVAAVGVVEWRTLFPAPPEPVPAPPEPVPPPSKPVPAKPEWKPQPQAGDIVNLCGAAAKLYSKPDLLSDVLGSLQSCEPLKSLADDANAIASATFNGETWLTFKASDRPAYVPQSSLCQSGLQSKC